MPNYHFVTISGLNFQFGHFIDVLLNISVILQNIKSQKIFRENRKNFFENWSKGGKAKYYNGLNQNKNDYTDCTKICRTEAINSSLG